MESTKQKVDLDGRVYDFVLRVIKLVRSLPKETVGREMARQLLRAATSIAANIEEARGAFSKNDFTFPMDPSDKMNTAFKEAREANLWLRFIRDSGLISSTKMADIIRESAEIRNILGASVKTAKKRGEKSKVRSQKLKVKLSTSHFLIRTSHFFRRNRLRFARIFLLHTNPLFYKK